MSTNRSAFEDGVRMSSPAMPGHFDFTPQFEFSMLSILPSSIFLAIVPFRLLSLSKRPLKVSKSLLHSNKLAFLAVFTVLQACSLAMYATRSNIKTPTTIAAASLALADALGLCLLSHAEHTRSTRPSTIINIYLFVTLLFDTAQVRTLWLDNAPRPIAIVFSATTAVKLLIAVAEAVEKRNILLFRYRNISPELTGGIYNRSFFWWLNTLMTRGFRRVIDEKDLYPIEDAMTSSILSQRAQTAWNNADKTRSHALFWSTLKATRRRLAVCMLPRICLIGFRYAQPFLLSRTISFVDSTTDSDNIGWGLTGAYALVFLGSAISNGYYYHMTYRFVTTVRGSLVGIIYAKTVDLNVIALNESIALTLMSNDTEEVCSGLEEIHELWAAPVELGLGLWLLQRQLGIAFLAPAAVTVFCTAATIWISKRMAGALTIWFEGIQTRVDVTTSMLGSMKAVKMLGFTENLTNILQGLRVKELQLSKPFRRLLCGRILFTNSFAILAPLMTFVIFVLSSPSTGRQFDTSTAYTTLSLIALIGNPIETLLRTLPDLTSALACLHRIQSYLESMARQNHVLPLKPAFHTNVDQDLTEQGGIGLGNLSPILDERHSGSMIFDVRNASFSWVPNGNSTVNDATFSVIRGHFTFIIGPVGCGKSTLLKGLMSETPSSKGFVYSDVQSTAYVDQTPWIQNTTIRDNILGQSNIDERWYGQVIWACALEHDLAGFPKGNDTLVGSRGISLSGGQKQRLSLARAVYARRDLIVIDDVLSGLDVETEEKVFVRLFGKQGLLRQLGTSIIFVTHAVHRLSYADYIIALNSTGTIVEQGSFELLRSGGGYVQGLASKHKPENEGPSSEGRFNLQFSGFEKGAIDAEVDNTAAEEIDLTRQTSEWSTYKYYFTSIGWSRCLITLSCLLVPGSTGKVSDLLLTYWTNAIAEHGTSVNSFYLGVYGMMAGVRGIFLFLAMYQYFMYVVPGSGEELHARLLSAVMGAPLHFFTSTDTGTTTNRFSQDMSMVDKDLPNALLDAMAAFILTIMGVILMCFSTGYFTLTMPPVLFAVWSIQKFYLRTSRQMRLLDLEAKSPLYSHFIETLSGLTTIRAFGWAHAFSAQNLVLLDASQKPFYLLYCIQRWLGLVLDVMVAILAVILMIMVVKLRGSLNAGYVGLALLNVMNFNASLSWLVQTWTALETSIAAIARLRNFATETPTERLSGENHVAPDTWPTYGEIEFRNLSASYMRDGELVLRDINMTIKPGEKIGVCGRTGSGKSSLIGALFRMLEIPSSSSIIVDGIDITTIPRQVVRWKLNAIPQDPFFMKGSIRLNATSGNTTAHSDADIALALQKVHLWEVVQSKGGLDADLDAEFFSHGQRQLFCLARGILRKSKIVVLDEVSSSVDVASDELMQRVVREEFADATIIAVAHRLDTILDFDRIALLRDGELVEMDTPSALLGSDSAFKELYYS